MDISHHITGEPSGADRVHHPSLATLASSYMGAVMLWNHAEGTMKQIVQHLLGQSAFALAIASEMTNQDLERAFIAASHEAELAQVSEHLRHFVTGFSRLRRYRNFYVHGIYATTVQNGLTAIQLLSIDGKKGVKISNPTLTIAEIQTYTESVKALIGYGVAIMRTLGAEGSGLDAMERAYQAKLEKPNWPPEVEKLPQYLDAFVSTNDLGTP